MSTVSTPVDDLLAFDTTSRAWRPVPGEPVVIYGAGGFARAVLRTLRGAGADVRFAIDERAAEIGALDGVPVHRPEASPLAAAARMGATAVVGVFNRAADPAAIEGRLRSFGFDRVVGVPELYESLGTELGSRFWLADRASYAEHRDDIERVGDLWADSASRELYRSLLRFRIRWDANAAPRPAAGAQYFPPDVPRGAGPMRFVDCGAFVGDTLATVAELGIRVDQVFAFEPDVRHFAQLARYGTELASATGASVALWPCAVAGESSPQRFRGDGGEAGHLAPDGDQLVTAVALDDALPGVIATDLKMDIEGAELDALRGAEELIRRGRPRLAICVYHRPEDLWRIPMFVRDLDLSYDFYLRSHALFGFDVVMYAVPRA